MLEETSINDKAVREALMNVEVDKINEYLRSGKIDVHEKTQFKNGSIWHYLALGKKKKNLDLLEAFLSFYIDEVGSEALNTLDDDGWSPLHEAADCENIAAIKLFVKYGANPRLLSELDKRSRDLFFRSTCPVSQELKRELERIIAEYDHNPPPVREPKPGHLPINVEIKISGLRLKIESSPAKKRSLSDAARTAYNYLFPKTATPWLNRSSTYHQLPNTDKNSDAEVLPAPGGSKKHN